MFTFKTTQQEFVIKIEPITHLLMLSEVKDGQEVGYIRLTLEQIDKLSGIKDNGGFYSKTRPTNAFSVVGRKVKMCCASDGQIIYLPLTAIKHIVVYSVYNRDHIAKRDLEFRSNR